MFGWNMLGAALALLLAAADPVAPTSPAPAPAATQAPAQAPAPSAPSPAPVSVSGQIRGSVSYGRRDPAAGAIVLVRPENRPSPIRMATTGTNGTFAFDGLADGTYVVEVRRDGYVPVVRSGLGVKAPFRAIVEVLLTRGAAPKEDPKPMEGAASLAGTIRTAGGAPLVEARVRLTRPDGSADARTIVTDASGAFAVGDLRAGRWHLDMQGAGLLPLRADLDLAADVKIEAQLAAQPANYHPLPEDLLLPEEVIPPPGP
jgi:hypothetical protein